MNFVPAVILLAALAALLVNRENKAVRAFHKNARPPGRLVDVGSCKIYLYAQGEKQPGQSTVVLVSGHGDWSRCWRKVQPEIARFARVVSYDRPGYGWSGDSTLARTPQNMVSELHAALHAGGEEGPFLLVGHSMGSAIARMYHHRYPGEVTGMVWVDPAHENMSAFIPLWSLFSLGLIAGFRLGMLLANLGIVRRFGAHRIMANYPSGRDPAELEILKGQVVTARFFRTLLEDTVALQSLRNWDGPPKPLGSLPVVSVEAQYIKTQPPGFSGAFWSQFVRSWRAMQADLRGLSTNLRWVHADSGHNVMDEQPQMVIQAVRNVLDQT
jgi:pimeloyl-ACP methyl ester carboxylesterase